MIAKVPKDPIMSFRSSRVFGLYMYLRERMGTVNKQSKEVYLSTVPYAPMQQPRAFFLYTYLTFLRTQVPPQ